MKYIRKRVRPDNLVNDVRKPPRSYGRIIYLLVLLVLIVKLADYFYGDMVFLRAEGVVVRDKISIDSMYLARVFGVNVKQGDTVQVGDPILQLDSMKLRQDLSEIELQALNERNTYDQLSAEKKSLEQEIKLLKLLLEKTKATEVDMRSLYSTGRITKNNLQEITIQRARDEIELKKLLTRFSQTSILQEQSRAKRNLLIKMLEDLSASYNHGKILAPVSGEIGLNVVSVGDVVLPADPLVEIYYGDQYIYAYLPSQYIRKIHPGLAVEVHALNQIFNGKIVKILPISSRIPLDFLNKVRPAGRYQILLIHVETPQSLPLNHRVVVY